MIHPNIYKREVKLSRTLHVYWFLRCLVSRRHPCRVFARFQPSIYATKREYFPRGTVLQGGCCLRWISNWKYIVLASRKYFLQRNKPSISCTLINYSTFEYTPSIIINFLTILTNGVIFNSRIEQSNYNISKLANFHCSPAIPLITRPNERSPPCRKRVPSRCRPITNFQHVTRSWDSVEGRVGKF